MKLITRNTDYALRALCYIAGKEGKVVPVAELTKELHTPHSFLRRILQELQAHGLLESCKGCGGGFSFSGDPSDISVVDVMAVFQGRVNLKECKLKKQECPNTKRCALRRRIAVIEERLIKDLRQITIRSLMNN